jgi:hypothetical protein
MLKAEQLAIIQSTSQQLLKIRELELNYFSGVFEKFDILSHVQLELDFILIFVIHPMFLALVFYLQ